jgi:hypothetical protein
MTIVLRSRGIRPNLRPMRGFNPILFFLVPASCFVAGCATPGESSSLTKKEPKPRSEWVYVTVTGSNVPIRVRREDRHNVKAENTVLLDPEALERMLRGRPARP